jgi:peptide methionine sulfoxide reductase MsrA
MTQERAVLAGGCFWGIARHGYHFRVVPQADLQTSAGATADLTRDKSAQC